MHRDRPATRATRWLALDVNVIPTSHRPIMKAIVLLALGLSFLPTLSSAQTRQLQAVMAPVALGAGPASFGIAPGRSFNSLYGTVDLAVNVIDAGGRSRARVQSGNAWTSKLGFYGQEDLGDSWTAFYRLESGFYANAGASQDPKSFFNRGSFVGVQHPSWGQVSLGRQFTSMGAAALGTDPFLVTAHESVATYLMTASGLGFGANNDALARLNNTVRYVTPRSASGFNADLSYSLKADRSAGPATHARTAMVNYAGRSLIATAGYGQTWCDPGSATCVANGASTAAVRTDILMGSLVYDLGPLVAQAGYFHFAPKSTGAGTANLVLLGAQHLSGNDLYRLSIGYRSTSISGNHAYGATAGMDHFLSKRTAIYTRVGLLRNGRQSSLNYNVEATAAEPLLTAGQSAKDLSVGLYHNF